MIIEELTNIVGSKNVLTKDYKTRRFRKGFRFGEGSVKAVVLPKSLVEQWQVLQACVKNDVVVIMQASNTGLTGGSTPFGDDYDREVIIISSERMNGVHLLDEGKQVVCMPGSTLSQLEEMLQPLGREPHSLLGSSCIGASVLGGVCNNSGGSLVRRGPVYTELALYAQIDGNGNLQLINHLGIDLGDDPETILSNLENRNFTAADVNFPEDKVATNIHYHNEIRDVKADTPARFNANPKMLYEASGSAGKLCVFAVRLDTFIKEDSDVFYIGTNDPEDLTSIRHYLLQQLPEIPIAAEYYDRSAFNIGAKYGKDVFMFISKFGSNKVPDMFALKNKIDSLLAAINVRGLTDKFIQVAMKLFPKHLPKFMYEYNDKYQHHLLLRVPLNIKTPVDYFLGDYFQQHNSGEYRLCTASEGNKAFLHRFAIAGAAVRYRETHLSIAEDVVALDIALRRNDKEWVEKLPETLKEEAVHILYYGHFLCHVFHQDYIVKKGVDPVAYEHEIWKLLDQRKAEYPAEHNVGHLYYAKPELAEFYKKLDPTNSFNPGIGHTSKIHNWQ